MEKRPGKEKIAKRLEKTWELNRAEKAEEERIRQRKEQEKRDAEVAGCLSSPRISETYEEAAVYDESETSSRPMRTSRRAQLTPEASIELPPEPTSEVTSLKAEIVQLREELDKTKARLKDLEDKKDKALEEQKSAALQDAQNEVARLKRYVNELDGLLEQTKEAKRQLQDQLHVSEDRIDELEEEVRGLKKRHRHEQNGAPPNDEDAKSKSAEKALGPKPHRLRTSKKSPSIVETKFVIMARKEKVIIRPKGGWVPVGLK
jgi:DNA repair exonuclease SbcCD ATPase subunit